MRFPPPCGFFRTVSASTDSLHTFKSGTGFTMKASAVRPPKFAAILCADEQLPLEDLLTASELRWDPFDLEIWQNPYPIYTRLRAEAPVYYNEQYDFYALSRFDDVDTGLTEWQDFSSRHGNIYEFIKQGVEIPSGTLLMEDPPTHDMHRALLVRVFTPRRVAALEPKIRAFIAQQLDPVAEMRTASTSSTSCPTRCRCASSA